MRLVLWAGATALFVSGLLAPRGAPGWTVVIMGDTQGYLSPCGCTSPMMGGIVRRAEALSDLDPDKSLVLDMGRLSGGLGRQNEMKAECLAESMSSYHVDASLLSSEDLALGPGFAANLASLGRFAWISATERPESTPVQGDFAKGPFLVVADDPGRPGASGQSLDSVSPGDVTVVLTTGGLERARELARAHPTVALVAYRSSTLTLQPEREGKTLLLSCGENGKGILRATWDGKKFQSVKAVELGPQFDVTNPSKAARQVADAFHRYLVRVDKESLVDLVDRSPTKPYAGNSACASCHASADAAWRKSEHAHALRTLEEKGQARDPECLPCHVVGLASTVGFKDRKTTPDLADVGCESCHGPLKEHAVLPASEKPPKIGADTCAKCHNIEHSPGFQFDKAWPKIAH